MIAMEEVDLMTVREVSRLLRLSDGAVYALCKSGRLPHHRLGHGKGAIRISRSDVLAYLRQCKEGAALPPVNGPPVVSPAPKGQLPSVGGFKHLRLDRLLGGQPPADAPSSDRGGCSAR